MPFAVSTVGVGPPPDAFVATDRISKPYGVGVIDGDVITDTFVAPVPTRFCAVQFQVIGYRAKILFTPLSHMTMMSPPPGVAGKPVAWST